MTFGSPDTLIFVFLRAHPQPLRLNPLKSQISELICFAIAETIRLQSLFFPTNKKFGHTVRLALCLQFPPSPSTRQVVHIKFTHAINCCTIFCNLLFGISCFLRDFLMSSCRFPPFFPSHIFFSFNFSYFSLRLDKTGW